MAPQPPPQAPLPVRRAKILDDKAASPWRSGITTEEPLATGASAEDRFARTLGALLIVTFKGHSAAKDGPKRVANALRQGRIGGVLLRRANIESPAQLKALTAFLAEGHAQAPLIMIEHSGGSDNTLAGFQPVASPRVVGARGDALEAFNIYQQMAESLADAGVSLNVGPSATACRDDASPATMDCFGRDLRHSAAFATAFNLAHQSQGVLTAMRYQAPMGGDGAALNEMAKRKAPDALVVGPQTANSPPGTKTANTLRPAGYSGAILLDSFDQQGTTEKLLDALNHGADMVLFRDASALETGLSDVALAGIRSAIGVTRHGKLPPLRHEELPPPRVAEETSNERRPNRGKPVVGRSTGAGNEDAGRGCGDGKAQGVRLGHQADRTRAGLQRRAVPGAEKVEDA